ncbi:hypothetical protein SNE40_006198 [Patella caerulea]|uniref:Uncharacterized protein n=1 Tax=Patella caerulea TaxID=87958 RepID=A0AAN8PVT3_PATCE
MLRIILITILVALTNAQVKIVVDPADLQIPLRPICKVETVALADALKVNSADIEKSAPLTDEKATELLASDETAKAPASPRTKRAASVAASARAELKGATGNILALPARLAYKPCPKYPAANSYYPQDVCPHRKELLTSFYSSGWCRVIYPYWQRKYQTRCLCNECLTGCKPTNGRRNLCRPTKSTRHSVWAFCRVRSGWWWTWQIKKVTISLADGDCDCKSYRSRC